MPASSKDDVVDAPTFDAFCRQAHDDVYRALVLTIGDAELAADAVQEALSKAYQQWSEVGRYANPTGWVYRVALNWSHSWLRRRSCELALRGRSERTLSDLPEPSDPAVSVEVATALDVSPGTVKSRLARALVRLREHLEVGS